MTLCRLLAQGAHLSPFELCKYGNTHSPKRNFPSPPTRRGRSKCSRFPSRSIWTEEDLPSSATRESPPPGGPASGRRPPRNPPHPPSRHTLPTYPPRAPSTHILPAPPPRTASPQMAPRPRARVASPAGRLFLKTGRWPQTLPVQGPPRVAPDACRELPASEWSRAARGSPPARQPLLLSRGPSPPGAPAPPPPGFLFRSGRRRMTSRLLIETSCLAHDTSLRLPPRLTAETWGTEVTTRGHRSC